MSQSDHSRRAVRSDGECKRSVILTNSAKDFACIFRMAFARCTFTVTSLSLSCGVQVVHSLKRIEFELLNEWEVHTTRRVCRIKYAA